MFSSCWESSRINSSIPLSRATHSLFLSCTELRQCSPHISTEPLTDRWAEARNFGQWEFWVMWCGSHVADSNITTSPWNSFCSTTLQIPEVQSLQGGEEDHKPYTRCTWLVWAQPPGFSPESLKWPSALNSSQISLSHASLEWLQTLEKGEITNKSFAVMFCCSLNGKSSSGTETEPTVIGVLDWDAKEACMRSPGIVFLQPWVNHSFLLCRKCLQACFHLSDPSRLEGTLSRLWYGKC